MESGGWPEDECEQDEHYFQAAPPPAAKVKLETELEPVCEDAPHPRYKPGIYQARCIAAVVYRDPRFRRYVARLKLQLVPDGRIVCAFRNLGSGEKPVVKRGDQWWMYLAGQAHGYGPTELYSASLPAGREPHSIAAEDRLAYSEGFLSGMAAPQASVSSRKADCQFRATTSWAQFRN